MVRNTENAKSDTKLPLKAVYLIGPYTRLVPGSKDFKSYFGSEFNKDRDDIAFIGDETHQITQKELEESLRGRIDRHTKIFLFGHGHVQDGIHQIDLVEDIANTASVIKFLESLAHDREPIQCWLHSCFSGAISNSGDFRDGHRGYSFFSCG